MAVGMPKTASHKDMARAWDEFYSKDYIKPKMVKTGPCKENVIKGDQVNLFQFPIPRINENDGSFYISKPMWVTKDPETDWVNVGMYRAMVLDRNKTGLMMMKADAHALAHFRKYAAKGQNMPAALVLGTEPVLPILAGSWGPSAECCEFDFAGAIRGEPEELVRAETVDLPVPASAEIVLEGEVNYKERVLEGPFGEAMGAYSGYFITPVFEIKAITHRNNPIFDCLFMGRRPAENHYMTGDSKIAGDRRTTRAYAPEVTDLALTPIYSSCMVLQGKWGHTGRPLQVMLPQRSKVVIAVDEDVDPWDAEDVLWAITQRCRADVDITIIPGTPPILDPSASLHGTTTRLLIDATKSRPPYHRHKPVGWIEPRAETPKWKEKMRELWKERR